MHRASRWFIPISMCIRKNKKTARFNLNRADSILLTPEADIHVLERLQSGQYIKPLDPRTVPAGLNHGEDEIFILNCLAKARRLYHSERIALHYHKDNPNSLSTVTSLEDLIGEQKGLCEFAEKHNDDPELLRAVRQRQSELWNNACYKRVFGGT